ncbi:Hypothetical predicted protein [Podarcis lilfordi]|uniref:Uncharacterized protein n=1 Tax=Podarcis lilfordi TaxID=74358 RepID=A0AA35L0E9_9SAUR|nr:Hypothetical predicted protein [Podarcis lilfordi]
MDQTEVAPKGFTEAAFGGCAVRSRPAAAHLPRSVARPRRASAELGGRGCAEEERRPCRKGEMLLWKN